MANTSISNLTAGGAVSGTDLFPDVQTVGVGPVKVTATQIKTFIVGAGSVSVASGKTLTVNNTLTLSGTDGTTMTFPSTSATLAGLGIANVFTQPQTFQPSIDGQAGTFRRLNGTQTSNILELQTEANAFLAGFDKSGLLTLGAASTQTGILKMAGTTSGTVSLSVADAAGTWTMKLPNSGGTNGFILTTDGSGNTSWTNPTSLGIDLDVGSTAITNGTAGRLLFEGTGNVLQESANLFWDNTNGRLGIGTSTPTAPLTVIGQVFQSKTTGDNQAYRGFVNSTNNSYIRLENTTGSFDVVQSNAVASITVNNSNPLTFLVGGSERMRITSDGSVGIGVTPGTNTSLSIGNAPTTGLNSFGVNIDYAIQSSATVAGTYFRSVGSVVASHTLPTLRHYYAVQGAFGAGSTVTNQFGFFAENSLTGAANNFGFYSNIDSGTGRWNFYANGTASNLFNGPILTALGSAAAPAFSTSAGNTGVFYPATTTIAFSTAGSERMRITSDGRVGIGAAPSNQLLVLSSNITGSTGQSGIVCNSTIQPDVTGFAVIYAASPSTAASTTLGTLTYFRANQNTLGGGTVVTSQFGFLVESSLTGATNNYGFFSDIASGSGRWNFYASGTAANHFRGQVLVTSATSVTNIITPNFQVNGTGADAFISATRWANAAGSFPGILLGKSRGASVGSFTLVNSGDSLGELSFTGDDGVAFQKAVQILAGVDGVAAAGSMPGNLRFLTTPSGSTTPAERMRIRSDGYIGIGSSGAAGMVIRSDNNITGATTGVGLTIRGTIQSDVTSLTSIFQSFPSTQATSFTLSQLIHYAAEQNTFGIGSTVTEQRGFSAGSSLTGATNNYGFYSNIASGTGRWNFYANGTANNAFAGNSRFGGLTTPTATVDVTGSVAATTTIRSSGATSGIGYATGAGGTVTQATSRTTGVTIDKVCGQITLVSAAGSTSWQSFTVTNSAVASTDTIIVNQDTGTDLYQIFVTNVAAGSFRITFATTGGTTTEQPVFGFSVIKAVAA